MPILLSGVWIGASEFVRNTFLLRDQWLMHYQSLGLVFPEAPEYGAVWGVWSLCYAVAIFVIGRRFNLLETTVLSWFTGFVFMWLVIGNLGVLPFGILPYAIPLSLLEAFGASFIVHNLSKRKSMGL